MSPDINLSTAAAGRLSAPAASRPAARRTKRFAVCLARRARWWAFLIGGLHLLSPSVATNCWGRPLQSQPDQFRLPDGSGFAAWDISTKFSRTYYVDQAHPGASDLNPGTKRRPFATINHAAQLLQPGERVVIGAGVYTERIRPARGGTAPNRMISYEARPGDRVILRGSRAWAGPWTAITLTENDRPVTTWQTELPADHGDGPSPFTVPNLSDEKFKVMKWAESERGKAPFTFVCGLVFQDDRRLTQVGTRAGLATQAGTYWVDRDSRILLVRLLDDARPQDCTVALTTQETVFAPDETGLGYIRVKGLTIEQVGGPWPFPQVGALSTTRGHHWIIEDCTVRQVNGVGIDVGGQHIHWPQPSQIGFHVVRRNIVTDCGISGISGLGPDGGREFGLLIEDNIVLRTSWHAAEGLFETGGIKTHRNVRCVIRRNLVADTYNGPGIWMDWGNHASRCSQNLILRTRSKRGAIFVEISKTPNWVDNNIVWDTEGSGIYEHDASNQVFAHNLVGHSSGPAFQLRGKVSDRKLDEEAMTYGSHHLLNNLCPQNGKPDALAGTPSTLSGNLSSGYSVVFDDHALELTLSFDGIPPGVASVPGIDVDYFGQQRNRATTAAGPFSHLSLRPTTYLLWHGPREP